MLEKGTLLVPNALEIEDLLLCILFKIQFLDLRLLFYLQVTLLQEQLSFLLKLLSLPLVLLA